jgi:hypothetical protein
MTPEYGAPYAPSSNDAFDFADMTALNKLIARALDEAARRAQAVPAQPRALGRP